MELNEGQKLAIETISQRYREGQPYSVLVGPAGTGKSASVPYIVQNLGLNPDNVIYLAPTGKAGQVLKQKGCPNAQTLHKFLYNAAQDSKGEWHFTPKEELDVYPPLIVADEASMIPPEIWRQLLTHKVPVLALGDDAQLSPISPEADNHLLDKPHARLTEIMRQAGGNEIIDLATAVRTNQPYQPRNAEVRLASYLNLNTGHYEWGAQENSQILCALNETRRKGNRLVRNLKGYNPEKPEIGDCVIGLKNHWNFMSVNKEPFTNGIMGRILDYEVKNVLMPFYGKYKLMKATIRTEDGDIFKKVPIDYNCLVSGKKTLTDSQEVKIKRSKKWHGPLPFELDYGYVVSVWKAQGSQWDDVMLIEENFPYEALEHRRYLYTGITRAAKRLLFIRK